ncbi:hypothetical protein [Vitiosangium sp. GDMCC 1.1324]|uniref:hypothetical protein n=1 Tax=Vitiosangium sp. (strain GDMCC 1.1324) TaxID=2138576 RepID=UPI000D3B6AFB|nr:hypothetical protein [Vitiosangium sp. GDMCC 1.1324]PTL82918.1 hypothetical protein DAT35_12870 [Vitiosangium sp. GDMCC 1.1324]
MSRNKLRGLVMFAALGFGALAGCGGMEDGSAAGQEPASMEQDLKFCRTNADCTNGQYCINSACRVGSDEPLICGDITCADGQICCVYNWSCQTACPFP